MGGGGGGFGGGKGGGGEGGVGEKEEYFSIEKNKSKCLIEVYVPRIELRNTQIPIPCFFKDIDPIFTIFKNW